MATVYATVSDVETIRGSSLTTAETTKATELLSEVSAELRLIATRYGVDIDEEIENSEDYEIIVKSVVVNTVNRALSTSVGTEGLSQVSQSALGYTLAGTYINPGNTFYISKNDLKRLGFGRQQFRGRDIYGISDSDSDT